jgi:hypothetical protein
MLLSHLSHFIFIVCIVCIFDSSSEITVIKGLDLGVITAPVRASVFLSTGCFVKLHLEQHNSNALPTVLLGSRRHPHFGQNSMNQNPHFTFPLSKQIGYKAYFSKSQIFWLKKVTNFN